MKKKRTERRWKTNSRGKSIRDVWSEINKMTCFEVDQTDRALGRANKLDISFNGVFLEQRTLIYCCNKKHYKTSVLPIAITLCSDFFTMTNDL